MTTWDWRGATGQREALTVYQLQQLVRSGEVGLDDEVRFANGPWRRVAEEPRLARLAPTSQAINGVALERDQEGRLLPPSSDQIALMLAQGAESEDFARSMAKARRVLIAVACLLFAGAAVLVIQIMRGLSASP